MSSNNRTKILAWILGLVVVAAGAYYYFSGSPEIPLDLIAPENSAPVGQDIIELAEKLDAVAVDATVFSSTLFTKLTDFSTAINQEPQGRDNPFAGIGL